MTRREKSKLWEKNRLWLADHKEKWERRRDAQRDRDMMYGDYDQGGQGGGVGSRYKPNPDLPTYPPPGPGYIWDNGRWVRNDRRPTELRTA